MTANQRSAVRLALPLAYQGVSIGLAMTSVRGRLSGVSDADVEFGVNYAYNSVWYGAAANESRYRNFADVPHAEEFGYNIRVRMLVDTRLENDGFAATIDVTTTAGASIEAVKDIARLYARDIRRKKDTLPGGAGGYGGLINPEVTITAIFNEEDNIGAAKKTVELK